MEEENFRDSVTMVDKSGSFHAKSERWARKINPWMNFLQKTIKTDTLAADAAGPARKIECLALSGFDRFRWRREGRFRAGRTDTVTIETKYGNKTIGMDTVCRL
jgi:hypothetical protein